MASPWHHHLIDSAKISPMPIERPQAHFNQLYLDISQSLAQTADRLADLRVDHEEGQKSLGGIRERLSAIRERFDGELNLLQQEAEWDKFTIAFFGETNAGKSTILESLRILFEEDGRQSLLQANAGDLARYEQALQSQIESVRATIQLAVHEHSQKLLVLNEDTARLSAIVQAESSTRVRKRHWFFALVGSALGAAATLAVLRVLAGH